MTHKIIDSRGYGARLWPIICWVEIPKVWECIRTNIIE